MIVIYNKHTEFLQRNTNIQPIKVTVIILKYEYTSFHNKTMQVHKNIFIKMEYTPTQPVMNLSNQL